MIVIYIYNVIHCLQSPGSVSGTLDKITYSTYTINNTVHTSTICKLIHQYI